MEYRVEELAGAAGIRVDTLRFYQGRGLLHPPRREGRSAIYDESHLTRLRRIRDLQQRGFTLAQIRSVLERDATGEESLLAALARESVGERTLTRAELARESGVPEALLAAAQTAGLLEPLAVEGEERFAEADLEMARAGLAVLAAGFPIDALLGHAIAHARHVQTLCDTAIDLFDEHVRQHGPSAGDADQISAVFQHLLPQVTRLVALHFQRTLVGRALNRLEGSQDRDALEAARAATGSSTLAVDVRWR